MYLDPGAGSIILQAIIAGVLGAGVLVKIFLKKIKSIFVKKDIHESNHESLEK